MPTQLYPKQFKPDGFGERLGQRVAKKQAASGVLTLDLTEPPDYFKDHQGQMDVWNAEQGIIAVLAGWQSGKSVSAPPWLLREMQRKGPGDYAILAPTAPLLRKKALPEWRKYLKSKLKEGVDWVEKRAEMEFHFLESGKQKLFGPSEEEHPETKVFYGHAMDPRAVEAFTAKAIWADEPGQMPDDTWEAIEARLAVEEGRALLTSRPYDNNWYVTKIWNERENDPKIKVINYSSLMNPRFPKEEYYRQKRLLPPWKFRMKYDGIPTRPAGSIYDCFEAQYEDEDGKPLPPRIMPGYLTEDQVFEITMRGANVCDRFEIPSTWRKTSGHDFGPVNTAAVFAAQDPYSRRIYIYRAYHSGKKTVLDHVKECWNRSRLPKGSQVLAWGGAKSEEKTRIDYQKAGWPIQEPPIADVIEGITRVYALLKSGVLVVFGDLEKLIQDFQDYSWKLDDYGEPLTDLATNIEDKATYHRLDCVRYLASALYEGFGDLFQVLDRFDDSEDIIEYDEESAPMNPFGHLGWGEDEEMAEI